MRLPGQSLVVYPSALAGIRDAIRSVRGHSRMQPVGPVSGDQGHRTGWDQRGLNMRQECWYGLRSVPRESSESRDRIGRATPAVHLGAESLGTGRSRQLPV